MATTKKGLGGTPLQRREPKAARTSSLVSAMRSGDDASVLTLDLDDTLWPFAPIGARIDQVLREESPRHVGCASGRQQSSRPLRGTLEVVEERPCRYQSLLNGVTLLHRLIWRDLVDGEHGAVSRPRVLR